LRRRDVERLALRLELAQQREVDAFNVRRRGEQRAALEEYRSAVQTLRETLAPAAAANRAALVAWERVQGAGAPIKPPANGAIAQLEAMGKLLSAIDAAL
jgi:hypothetical protein